LNAAEICEDIATGTLNETLVTDENIRKAVLPLLLEKDPEWRIELAKRIREDCLSEDGVFKQDGIIPRLWPNCEVVDTGGTGTMKVLVHILQTSNICSYFYLVLSNFRDMKGKISFA
jgi:hypothetical protein